MPETKFVAEISSNHNQDLERALEFIKVAHGIGCDAIKFQLFKIDKLFAPEVLVRSEILRARKDWELPTEFIPKLSNYTHELGMEFACTPFYLEAVDILLPYVDFYKIASYELLWNELFEKCSQTGKPLVFSVGMATMAEISEALSWIERGKTHQVTILHCNSSYPTPISEVNLSALKNLEENLSPSKQTLDIQFGWSDHTVNPGTIYRAVHRHRSGMIEFHLDLDKKGEEYGSGHCWLPEDIKRVISDIKDGFTADGSEQLTITASESDDRRWRADPGDGLRPLKSTRADYS